MKPTDIGVDEETQKKKKKPRNTEVSLLFNSGFKPHPQLSPRWGIVNWVAPEFVSPETLSLRQVQLVHAVLGQHLS